MYLKIPAIHGILKYILSDTCNFFYIIHQYLKYKTLLTSSLSVIIYLINKSLY